MCLHPSGQTPPPPTKQHHLPHTVGNEGPQASSCALIHSTWPRAQMCTWATATIWAMSVPCGTQHLQMQLRCICKPKKTKNVMYQNKSAKTADSTKPILHPQHFISTSTKTYPLPGRDPICHHVDSFNMAQCCPQQPYIRYEFLNSHLYWTTFT